MRDGTTMTSAHDTEIGRDIFSQLERANPLMPDGTGITYPTYIRCCRHRIFTVFLQSPDTAVSFPK